MGATALREQAKRPRCYPMTPSSSSPLHLAPGRRPGAGPVWQRLRIRSLLVTVLAGLLLGFSGAAAAQELIPQSPGLGYGGSSSFGTFSPADTWIFSVTPFGLADVDPLSGGIIGGHADLADGFGHSAVQTLMETNRMAFDAAQLAARVRAELEKKRAAALRQGVAVKAIRDLGYPEDWEMEYFSECGVKGNARYRARIEVVMAWEIMCRDAEAAGVRLGIVSAYRSVEHQTRLFNDRVAREVAAGYSRTEAEARARKWVAPPGRSQHNRGLAIDTNTSTDPKVLNWFHTRVGCYSPPDNLRLGDGISCSSNEEVVKRVQLYGFVLPMDYEPWHIELGVTIDAGPTAKETSCAPAGGLTVTEMIGAIWRCRLTEGGFSAAEQEKIVAEAIMVSQCESGWKPTAFIYGGRYANTPNPEDGKIYTARGVFQFIRVSGDNWISGGWANADNPQANIDAAARYYVFERGKGREGWGPWSCRRVLPQYGGKALPSWAYQY